MCSTERSQAGASPSVTSRSEYSYTESESEPSTRRPLPAADDRPPLARLVQGAQAFFGAIDEAVTDFMQGGEVAYLPPRPERRIHDGRYNDDAARLDVERRLASSIEWREMAELRAVLAENASAMQGMQIDYSAHSVEQQHVAGLRGQVESREAYLRKLKAQIDSAPAARAAALASLNQQVQEETAALHHSHEELSRVRDGKGLDAHARREARHAAAEAKGAEKADGPKSVAKLSERLHRLEARCQRGEQAAIARLERARSARLARLPMSMSHVVDGALDGRLG